ncbi:3-demethylubiquinone-9 3-methyltransferase [Thalassospira sp. HJ]|uniref:VOC family protein n=1 Tax=Thalassospira sp. HJ TaxID=1616823 RepID=UPI0005CE915C|nr:VOC family protein [Thalassospira sp. HJ]KJE33607.1 3-demethylubiquinone-9 3-methyltransferase [Thalassospira sp. HJ]
MKVISYLNFDGNCRPAMEFYQSVLGGELIAVPYGDTPMAGDMPDMADKMAHACLVGDGWNIMASDCPPGNFEAMKGMNISIHAPTAAKAREYFDGLAVGGTVIMPFEETFWSKGFGLVNDKFGTPWMINTDMARA